MLKLLPSLAAVRRFLPMTAAATTLLVLPSATFSIASL